MSEPIEQDSKRALGMSPDASNAEPRPSSEPQSGAKLRCDRPTPSDDEPTEKFPRELAQAILLEHLAEHCASWPDRPHPALHGETPRKIAEAMSGRDRVEALVCEMEQQARGTLVARACDFERLRLELGLAPRWPASRAR